MKIPRAGTVASRGSLTRTGAFGLAALVAVLALGAWGVSAYREAQLNRAVTALASDASQRLEAALALEDGAAGGGPQVVAGLDEQAQEVDKNVIALRDAGASPNVALAAAAEDYLLTVRQILRELAASHRYGNQVSASETALREHMGTARRRTAAWLDEAMSGKERLEKSYFDYRVSVEALERLLAGYPTARKKMAEQIKAPLLADEAAERARARVLDASKRITQNVEQARQLAAVR